MRALDISATHVVCPAAIRRERGRSTDGGDWVSGRRRGQHGDRLQRARRAMGNRRGHGFERYREAVYARLRRYTWALDQADDRLVAALAREELPRYVRYWMTLLAEHEPSASGHCRACSRWWHAVSVPCATWKWAHAFLTVTPARAAVPPSGTDEWARRSADKTRTVAT